MVILISFVRFWLETPVSGDLKNQGGPLQPLFKICPGHDRHKFFAAKAADYIFSPDGSLQLVGKDKMVSALINLLNASMSLNITI